MPAAHKTARIIEPQRSILVFQGGGALGAYQAGVFEAFEASGRQPDWVVGTSIGAIHAALIAGNPPKRRLERIKTFWDRMSQPENGLAAGWSLCEEVRLNLACYWFCRLSLKDVVPNYSTFSKNRHGRFRECGTFRWVYVRRENSGLMNLSGSLSISATHITLCPLLSSSPHG